MDVADHVDALVRHGLGGAVDVVIVHDAAARPLASDLDGVRAGERALERVRAAGVVPLLADVADPEDWRHHRRESLLAALRQVAL
jgi:hypothetical protein